MKLHTADQHPVERIGDTGTETQFTITSNAQAFEILSAGIYTDPITAVIRELSCNAYDAHVAAGKETTPFIIHMPTALEPYFSVRDEGTGLSDEDIRGLYSSYFQSNKTDTNTQIGGFGLGSKSPFSYSKAFDVIARFDGVQRTYTIFVNEDGVPTIQELAKIDTTKPNGIEVKLAVRQQDYHTFITKAARVLRYFPVKPTVIGVSEFEFPQYSDTAVVTDTYVIDRDSNNIVAVQGNVPYAVSTDQIDSHLSSACRRFADNNGITLFFDIGSLDIAANREEVRYDEHTSKNIAAALQVAFDDYLVQVDNKISDLTKAGSVWEIYRMLREKFGSAHNLKTLVGGNFKFTSDVANDWIKSDELQFAPEWKYHKIVPYGRGDIRAIRKSHSTSGFGKDRMCLLRPADDIQVVLQDCTQRGSMRMNEKLVSRYTNGIKTLIAITPITDRALKNMNTSATSKQRSDELTEILNQMGNPEIKIISEWTEDVVPAARATRTSGHTFKQLSTSTGRKKVQKPEFHEVVEPTDGGLYIEIDQLRNIIIKGEKKSIYSRSLLSMLTPVLNVINIARGTEYKPTDVYGITKKVVKYVSDKPEWDSVADAYAEAIVDQMDIIEYYRRIGNTTTLNLGSSVAEHSFIQMVKSLDTKSTFRTIVEPIIDLSKSAIDLARDSDNPIDRTDFRDHLVAFETYHGITHDVKADSFFTNTELEEYFMLRHLSLSYSNECNDAKRYIELVERV